jgi:hypothetical protein
MPGEMRRICKDRLLTKLGFKSPNSCQARILQSRKAAQFPSQSGEIKKILGWYWAVSLPNTTPNHDFVKSVALA